MAAHLDRVLVQQPAQHHARARLQAAELSGGWVSEHDLPSLAPVQLALHDDAPQANRCTTTPVASIEESPAPPVCKLLPGLLLQMTR